MEFVVLWKKKQQKSQQKLKGKPTIEYIESIQVNGKVIVG